MKSTFTFVDLFSGIGGFRIALERCGGSCLGYSEIDDSATATYNNNFINSIFEWKLGDITKVTSLPKPVDMITGGVPCQSWSVAGKMKGFEDPRGRLWYDAIRLVKTNQPKVFIFENVKGLADPRNKQNLDLIIKELESAGYIVPKPQLLNSYDFGLPQNRARIFIVGFRKDLILKKQFSYPRPISKTPVLSSFIEGIKNTNNFKSIIDPKILFEGKIPVSRNKFQKVDELNDFFVFCDTRNGHSTVHSWDISESTKREKEICMTILKNRRKKIYGDRDGNPLSFQDIKELLPNIEMIELEKLVQRKILKKVSDKFEMVNSKNSSGINGIYRVFLPNSNIFSTLTATGTRDFIALESIHAETPEEFKEVFVNQIYKKNKYRLITPREAGRLQGFGDNFKPYPSSSLAMKQFGNAVSVNVVEALANEIIKTGIFE